MAPPKQTFYDVITAAVADIADHGYDSAERVAYWMGRIREAAATAMAPPHVLEEALQQALRSIYRRLIERGEIARYHPGVAQFTLEKVRPQLRAELDRRILASANLIKLNRQSAIETTLRRFSGWSSSVPAGGSRAVDKRDVKTDIRKAMAALPFEERRVVIDQGTKFIAALSETLAKDGAAIALTWRSHWRQAGYNYREDHKERDGKVYVMRNNWAQERGLMKAGPGSYYDEITHVGEEVYCRCYAVWIYALRDLPEEMLTAKGRGELARVRLVA